MDETLEIPLTYKKDELVFKAHVVRFGYVHHIVVEINDTPVTIERDEEGNFRALVNATGNAKESKVDVELVKALVDVLTLL